MKQLPQFVPQDNTSVEELVHHIFYDNETNGHFVEQLISFEDHHFRVVFNCHYFAKNGTLSTPTRSQWNTIKKKFKRRHPLVFVFKEYGYTPEGSCYIDFGFVAP